MQPRHLPSSTLLLAGAILLLLAGASSAHAAANGRVSTFEVQANGTGAVRVYDEVTGALVASPAGLTELTLLPLEVNGRTHLHEFAPGAARLGDDVPGATRVVLPGGRGSLYHFTRTDAQGARTFGFFVVPPRGSAVLVHERLGAGAGQLTDPFLPRVACAPGGEAFLVATVPAAGGDVLEVRIGPPSIVIDRTAQLPPRRFYPQSLGLASGWGVFAMKRALFRFDRSTNGPAGVVSFGVQPAPNFVSGAVVLAQNGAFAAAAAGSSSASLDAFVFGPTGDAQRASTAPGAITGAGFLPEAEDGPHLAVSDDGGACAWRVDTTTAAGLSRECWIGRVQAPPTDPPAELSSDANFLDTLDEVGVFVFRTPARLQLGVGSQTAPGVSGLESTDLFQVDLPATVGAAQFTNLSLSSGDATLPFLAVPSISLARTALFPATGHTWYVDDDSNGGAVYVARPDQVGAQVVLPDVKDLFAWEFTGGWAWIWTRNALGARPRELHRVPIDLSLPAALIASDDAADFSRRAVRADGVVACIAATPTTETLLVTTLATGATQTLALGPGAFGPTLTFTPGGALAYSTHGPGGAPVFQVWTPGGANVVLQSSGALDGFVLR